MKKIFIINGSGGVGKDTFVDFVLKNSKTKGLKYSSVEYVKEVARKCFYWDGKKDERGRKLLSDIKDIMTEYDNIPFNKVVNFINTFLDDGNLNYVFLFIREPEEIRKIKNMFSFRTKVILIRNNNVDKIESNHADREVEEYKNYDYIISNNGSLKILEQCAKDFCGREGI